MFAKAEGAMKEVEKYGWRVNGAGWPLEEAAKETRGASQDKTPLKTVMVYWLDRKSMVKEPLGILVERRKAERENENNVVGMLRLARKEFARSEEESSRIIIGDYI
jgi:hypothetical protein